MGTEDKCEKECIIKSSYLSTIYMPQIDSAYSGISWLLDWKAGEYSALVNGECDARHAGVRPESLRQEGVAYESHM